MSIFPAQAHLLNCRTFWFRSNKTSVACTMCLAESVTSSSECHSLFIIHSHTSKCFSNIFCACYRIWIAIWPFGIYIDQAHLNCSQWIFQLALSRISFVTEPFRFFTPINIFFRGPDIWTSTTEPKSLTSHRLNGDITSQDQQISPTDLRPVLLLNWPQESARFIQIPIVWPAIERGKTLSTSTPTSSTITYPISTSGMPSHTNEERTIMSIVCRPPVL